MKRSKTASAVRLVLRGAAVGAFLLAAAACGGGEKSDVVTTSTTEVDAPTTVFGRQARELAVGIAARRRGADVELTTTVLGQDGTRRRGLRVAYAAAGDRWVEAEPCGPGRYCGDLPVAGPSPIVR